MTDAWVQRAPFALTGERRTNPVTQAQVDAYCEWEPTLRLTDADTVIILKAADDHKMRPSA